MPNDILYPRNDDGVTTTARFRRRVGHEIEIADDGEFARALWDLGAGTPRFDAEDREGYWWCEEDNCWYDDNDNPVDVFGLHSYQCDCDMADQYLVHTTSDCTAPGGEHIIGGLSGVLYGSPIYMEALDAVAQAAKTSGSHGANNTGGHIHVSTEDARPGDLLVLCRNVLNLWSQLETLAEGAFDGGVRSNDCMNGVFTASAVNYDAEYDPDTDDLWNVDPDKVHEVHTSSSAIRVSSGARETVEFRLWNTMVSKWRLYMAAGVSAALVEAAIARRETTPSMDLLDHLDGLLTPDVVMLVERQRAINRGDVALAA